MSKPTLKEVKAAIEEKGYDLKRRMPRGSISKLSKKFNIKDKQLIYMIGRLRQESKVLIQNNQQSKTVDFLEFQKVCRNNNFIRLSKQETRACETISKFIMDKLPRGGNSLLIGTPTALCAGISKTFNKKIAADNLMVAHVMRLTSDSLTIAIGSGVDEEKAAKKAAVWKSLTELENPEVITECINRDSYTRLVTRAMEKYSLCKVVLLTSGLWEGSASSRSKYKFDTNFQTPSKHLTNIYPNLHILALTKHLLYKFSVKYVHKGTEHLISEF